MRSRFLTTALLAALDATPGTATWQHPDDDSDDSLDTLQAQVVWYPARQSSQVLSEAQKEPTTKSPTWTVWTSEPTSSTTPTYS